MVKLCTLATHAQTTTYKPRPCLCSFLTPVRLPHERPLLRFLAWLVNLRRIALQRLCIQPGAAANSIKFLKLPQCVALPLLLAAGADLSLDGTSCWQRCGTHWLDSPHKSWRKPPFMPKLHATLLQAMLRSLLHCCVPHRFRSSPPVNGPTAKRFFKCREEV